HTRFSRDWSSDVALPIYPRLIVDRVFKSFPAPEPRRSPWSVLEGIDFAAAQGEFVVVTGPSGCGKTTLLDVIAGFTECDRGRVRSEERRVGEEWRCGSCT